MSVTSTGISQLVNINQPTTAPSGGAALGANAFLTLLTTELRNQDPTKPQDPTQSVTQLAQFSSLQYQQQLTSAFQGFQSNFGVLQSASLVGKTATFSTGSASSGNASTVTGTITSMSVQNGNPYFTMNGSNGQPVTDTNGSPLLFSVNNLIGVGT